MPVKISLITATLNRAHVLGDALSSVAAQTYRNVEHIVIDGGSVDHTQALVAAAAVDVFHAAPDSGVYEALNKGIALATGDVIGVLHSDDVFASVDVLERVASCFEDPSVMVVYGDLEYVKRDDVATVVRKWRAGTWSPEKLARGWMPPHPTLYVRKSVLDQVGGYDLQYRISSDYQFILRVFSLPNLRIHYEPYTLVRMRMGGMSNKNLANLIQKSREDVAILRALGKGGLPTVLLKNVSKSVQVQWWNVLSRVRPS